MTEPATRDPRPDESDGWQGPARDYWRLWRVGGRPDVRAFLAEAGPLTPAQVADVLCVDQDERWQAGERVPAEHYLTGRPLLPADSDGALGLIGNEFLLRERLGESPALHEFQERFPQFADRLRPQIESHRPPEPSTAPGPQEGGTVSLGTPPLPDAKRAVQPWPSIPGYEILGELGRGGMGVVYQARQLALKRLVALKMIRGADAGPEELARFRREAEAVARLQHPHIVQVYDVGEHDGRPFCALEFVEGGSLKSHLQGAPLPPADAARLVGVLARAAHYAHGQGVIHRDLKPANVLLAAPAGAGAEPQAAGLTPKIADFGLAKQLADEPGFTQTGQVIGTPSYMAPEQARGEAKAVGALADVYALGAVLYELLTGRPPFRAATAYDTVQQVLHDDPVPPSRLQPQCPRDVETICLKCLSKEPVRRYASADALADDLQRFLDGRPILARPVGTAERALKWARRRPALAGLLAVSAAAVVVVVAVLAVANARAGAARLHAEREGREASAARDSARDRLRKACAAVDQMLTRVAVGRLADVPQMEPVRRELLKQALGFYQGFLEEEGADPELRRETALAYQRVGEIHQHLGGADEAERAYAQAAALYRKLGADFPEKPGYRLDLAVVEYRLGTLLQTARGRSAEAEAAYRRGVDLLREPAEKYPEMRNYRQQLARLYTNLGNLCTETSRPQDGERSYRLALAIQERLLEESPKTPEYLRDLALTHYNLGVTLRGLKRPKESEEAYRRALELRRQLAAAGADRAGDRRAMAQSHEVLGTLLRGARQLDEAEKAYRQALELRSKLAADFPATPPYRADLALSHESLGRLQQARGRLRDAEKSYRLAQDLREKLAAEFPAVPAYQSDCGRGLDALAALARRRGDHAEAARLEGLAVVRQRAALDASPKHPTYRKYLRVHYGNLVDSLVRVGDHAGAAGRAEEQVRLWPDDPAVLHAAGIHLGWCLLVVETDASLADGKRDGLRRMYGKRGGDLLGEAIEHGTSDWVAWYQRALLYAAGGEEGAFRGACAEFLKRFGEDEAMVHWLARTCALAADAGVDRAAVMRLGERSLVKWPKDYLIHAWLGAALYRAGRLADAEARLREAQKLHGGGGAAWDLFLLAMARHRRGDAKQARAYFDQGAAWVERAEQGKLEDPAVGRALTWNQRLEVWVLRREAERLLRANDPAAEATRSSPTRQGRALLPANR